MTTSSPRTARARFVGGGGAGGRMRNVPEGGGAGGPGSTGAGGAGGPVGPGGPGHVEQYCTLLHLSSHTGWNMGAVYTARVYSGVRSCVLSSPGR